MPAAPTVHEPAPLRHPLATPAFALVWAGLLVSVLGDQLYRVALTLSAASRGPVGLATLGIALALPTAVIGLVAGVYIDRHERLGLLIRTDVARCAIVAVLGVLLLSHSSFVAVIGLAMLLTFVSVIFTPALQAVLPAIAEGDTRRLIAMDAWILSALSLSGVIGPALAGMLLQWTSSSVLMFLDAATFAFSALMIIGAGRRLPAHHRTVPGAQRAGGSRLKAVGEGLRFLMRHPVLGPCFRTFPLMDFALNSVPFVLPLVLSASGSHGSERYGAMLGALAVGRVGGMVLLNKTSLKQRRGSVLRYNFLIQGAAVLVFAMCRGSWIGVLPMVLVGLPAGAAQVSMSSYVQMEVEPAMRGRVFAALTSMVTWLAPLGPLVFVAIAATTSATIAMAAIGGLLALGGVRLFLCRPLAHVH